MGKKTEDKERTGGRKKGSRKKGIDCAMKAGGTGQNEISSILLCVMSPPKAPSCEHPSLSLLKID